jgi:hypothetical protein
MNLKFYYFYSERFMTPLSFEWQWDAAHFIFMGLLYLVLAVIGAGVTYAVIKTWMALNDDESEEKSHESH